MAGLDLTKHRPVAAGPRTVVPDVDLSRFAGYQARVTQLAALMAEPCARGHFRPLIQFVKDWNYWVESRAEMLDGPPPAGTDPFHAASIAAVVHALVARDGVEVPAWVHQYRAEPARLISGHATTTNFGRLVVAEAPQVCAQHGVYFEADLLDRGQPQR